MYRLSLVPHGTCLNPLLLIALVLLVSYGCTSTAPARTPPIPVIESLAIESKGATRELNARFGVAAEDRVSGKTALAGAGAGAAAGAGWAMVCGPYFFLCALAVVPTAALVGGTTGGLAGSASDAHKTPPDEQLLALDQQFSKIHQQRSLHMDIRDSLEKQIPADRLADPALAEAIVELTLSDVRFTRTVSNKYRWTLKSIMVVTWNRHGGRARHSYEIYEDSSAALPLDEWLQNDGEQLSRALDNSVQGLARRMAADIRFNH